MKLGVLLVLAIASVILTVCDAMDEMYAKAEAEAEAQEHGGIRQRTDRAPSKQPQQVNAKNIESIHQGEGEEDEDKDAQCSGVDCCVGASYQLLRASVACVRDLCAMGAMCSTCCGACGMCPLHKTMWGPSNFFDKGEGGAEVAASKEETQQLLQPPAQASMGLHGAPEQAPSQMWMGREGDTPRTPPHDFYLPAEALVGREPESGDTLRTPPYDFYPPEEARMGQEPESSQMRGDTPQTPPHKIYPSSKHLLPPGPAAEGEQPRFASSSSSDSGSDFEDGGESSSSRESWDTIELNPTAQAGVPSEENGLGRASSLPTPPGGPLPYGIQDLELAVQQGVEEAIRPVIRRRSGTGVRSPPRTPQHDFYPSSDEYEMLPSPDNPMYSKRDI